MQQKLVPLVPLVARSERSAPRAGLDALLAAPHRPAFLAGMLMLVVVSAWWAALLTAPALGANVRTTLPPMMVHGFTFAAAFMPLFMTGFLFTAGPRWLDVPAPSARTLKWPVLLHIAGVVLLVAGVLLEPAVTAFGALLLAIAWTSVGVGFAGLIRASRARDKLHAKCVMAFWTVGIACALLFASAVATRHFAGVSAALWLLIFGFITPIYATVAHRVLPFFTSNAVAHVVPWRPNWALALLLAALLAFGALQISARLGLLPADANARLTLVVVAPAALLLAWLAVRWGLLQSLAGPSLRLLAMLHLGFAWAVIALLLASADAALSIAGAATLRLGLAPLHALTMGFLGGLLFAMATRVISGHGGIALVADAFVWRLFWLLQIATLLRLVASAWPARAGVLSAAAAVVWLFVWLTWAARYAPVLMRPRRDGRSG
jgi:uncharacterized protein involved in response to NO